jgi:transcriptional regulator with XRE-family HTH domain
MRKQRTPLANLRRTRTMNQADLAMLADISQQTLSKYERGLLVPTPDMQARLAAILGVSVDQLFPAREAVAS